MEITKKQLIKELKVLCELPGPSGREEKIAAHIIKQVEEMGLSYSLDNLGNVMVSYGNSTSPRLLVCGHMDEVGFLVIDIKPTGLIEAKNVGGLNLSELGSTRVKLITRNNQVYRGCINDLSPHLSGEMSASSSLCFDFGFKSDREAKKLGVHVQDIIVFDEPFVLINKNKRFMSKAIDDRYGCALGLALLRNLVSEKKDICCNLTVAFSVQEEVGSRGIAAIIRKVKPDLCIIVDASPARDGFGDLNGEGKLDSGVLVRYLDRGQLFYKPLLDWQIDVCNRLKVPHQLFFSPGGTDGGVAHKELNGVYTLVHGICLRNIHGPSGMASVDDLYNAHKSLCGMVEGFDNKLVTLLKNGGI